MAIERSFVMVKPDGVQRGLVGEVVSRLERRGLKLVAAKFMQISREQAERHYESLQDKPFFPGLIQFITSGPVLAMVWAGPDAIGMIRTTMGATNPVAAAPGTLRADFAVNVGRNIVHGSDGPETAEREINLWFRPEELVSYDRANDPWITEPR